MGTWRNNEDTAKLASFLATQFGPYGCFWKLLDKSITYELTCEVRVFFEKAMEDSQVDYKWRSFDVTESMATNWQLSLCRHSKSPNGRATSDGPHYLILTL
ncbi:hypothetical protein TNCV_4217961 [Trichonephila clavipes]|nr:hypothetical protein TNCV_4217961 [Trichonephila clavipes]